jgi:hypothetical protein
MGKTEKTVERIAHEAAEGLARLARGTLLAVVKNLGPWKADPSSQTGEEAVLFRKLVERGTAFLLSKPKVPVFASIGKSVSRLKTL